LASPSGNTSVARKDDATLCRKKHTKNFRLLMVGDMKHLRLNSDGPFLKSEGPSVYEK
jgi:hypothetical protein